jgi:hypothetical protein
LISDFGPPWPPTAIPIKKSSFCLEKLLALGAVLGRSRAALT